MKIPLLISMFTAAASALVVSAYAQDIGRVTPATVPIALPASSPMPPDQLRAHNPWNLPMTGDWRFQLTHGQIKAGQFVPSAPVVKGLSASTTQTENPPDAAFDGDETTRWCASSADYPQWLQADLGSVRHVSGASISWENAGDHYQCRIEGRAGTGKWKTLFDATAAPGIADGPVTLTPADVRYVRITVTDTSGPHWASIREFKIMVEQNGQQVAWQPPAPPKIAPALSTVERDFFAAPGYNDSSWHTLAVPSNWEMAGYSVPTYDAVDNTVGLYRRMVSIPANWAGKSIYWHFDGALDGAEIFVNGQKAGYHESGYTAFDVNLTGLIHPGEKNLFAVRVSKMTPSFDADTGDFQSMGGIYRDTSLIAVPRTHVTDITVRTPLDANYKDATLSTLVNVSGIPGTSVNVTGRLFRGNREATTVTFTGTGVVGHDGSVQIASNTPVQAPALWSAEKPNLYYAVFQVSTDGKLTESVEQRFGFKQIDIKNNVVLWNGMPIKCTGICRHDFWADKGFALTEANWVKDLDMMKAANINAVRTSHYNHAQRFLELCDEKGMYILDEVPYCWINDQVKDVAYAPFLLQRGQETVARDKNRPCVLAWSLGNENPYGIDSQMVLDLVHSADPTRPAFVSGENPESIKGQAWQDNHYPGPDSIDRFARDTRWGANLTEHPHTFYEKELQDYDPGASDLWSETLIKTWDKLWKAPNILGSFIWEWQNQGVADKNADKTTDFWYGTDHMRQENNKGVVDAYRNPKPEWWIVKSAYSPVVVSQRTVTETNGVFTVPITNHYSFTDLTELNCHWSDLRDGKVLQSGTMHFECRPMDTRPGSFPAPAGTTQLRLNFTHPDGSSVIAYNLAVDTAALPAAPAALAAADALATQDSPDSVTVHNAMQQISFDKSTGSIRSWRVRGRDLLVGGPTLNLGEGKKGSERGVYRAKGAPVTNSAQIIAIPSANGDVQITVTSNVQGSVAGPALGTLVTRYDVKPNAEMTVDWSLNWTAPGTELWEEGVKFALPGSMKNMAWLRDSYFTDYPAGHVGEPSGTAQSGDVLFRSTKRGLHWMTLTDSNGTGLALLPADLPLSARADSAGTGTVLFASTEVAGPHGLSGSWVANHVIRAETGKSLTGAFTLRAFDSIRNLPVVTPIITDEHQAPPSFTPADADTAVKSYLAAFVVPRGDGSFIKGRQTGGDPGFWQEIEQIEGIEDANDRTHGAYKNEVGSLLRGFLVAHGRSWSDNIYNDDISWATIAYTRGYVATGDKDFLTVAKDNFDMMWARAWDPSKKALFWTTNNTSYNSCVECPAGIASFLLGQSLGDSAYRTKAQSLLDWEKANLFNAATGAASDAINVKGEIGTWASSYNQGTFVGLADFLGDTASAKLAADYTMHHIGSHTPNGYNIMPEYGSGGDNNSGLNSIGLRWIARFMKGHKLEGTYLTWLQANANTAWSLRRQSDNLSWDQWLHATPGGVLHSWDCINSVVALQVTPAKA